MRKWKRAHAHRGSWVVSGGHDHQVSPRLDVEARCHLISACWRAELLERAESACREACDAHPSEPRLWEALGDTLAMRARTLRGAGGDVAEVEARFGASIDALRRACGLAVDSASAHRSRERGPRQLHDRLLGRLVPG